MWTKENTQQQLIEGIIKHGPSILDHCLTSDDIHRYLDRIDSEHLNYPIPTKNINLDNWFIPNEYKDFDIENWLLGRCPDTITYTRAEEELKLYRKNGMIPVLKTMKYLVDILRENKVVWGVGRGSSVSSYVLYLIGVHKIDSVKYNLPIDEFFKGENNG